MMGTPFHHNEQSLRVVDKLERDGDGLNLTYEVRMAILGHTGPRIPETLEGQVVRTSDRIAYINHDIDDAMRGGSFILWTSPWISPRCWGLTTAGGSTR